MGEHVRLERDVLKILIQADEPERTGPLGNPGRRIHQPVTDPE